MARVRNSNSLELRFKGTKKLKILIQIVARYETGIWITGEPKKGYRAKLWPNSGSGCDWDWAIYDLYKAGFRLPEKYRKMAKEIEKDGGI